jgi:hypothetical protein
VPFLGDRTNGALRQQQLRRLAKLSRFPKEILFDQVDASFRHDETAVASMTAMRSRRVCIANAISCGTGGAEAGEAGSRDDGAARFRAAGVRALKRSEIGAVSRARRREDTAVDAVHPHARAG